MSKPQFKPSDWPSGQLVLVRRRSGEFTKGRVVGTQECQTGWFIWVSMGCPNVPLVLSVRPCNVRKYESDAGKAEYDSWSINRATQHPSNAAKQEH